MTHGHDTPDYTDLFCDVLTAYRRDLERTEDVVSFGTHDDRWIQVALRVERAVTAAWPRRADATSSPRLPRCYAASRCSRLPSASKRLER